MLDGNRNTREFVDETPNAPPLPWLCRLLRPTSRPSATGVAEPIAIVCGSNGAARSVPDRRKSRCPEWLKTASNASSSTTLGWAPGESCTAISRSLASGVSNPDGAGAESTRLANRNGDAPGRCCGDACHSAPAVVIASTAPPLAPTLEMPVPELKRIVSSVPQLPPNELSLPAAARPASTTGTPPSAGTFFSSRDVKNAIHCPSGEKNGRRALSVLGISRNPS